MACVGRSLCNKRRKLLVDVNTCGKVLLTDVDGCCWQNAEAVDGCCRQIAEAIDSGVMAGDKEHRLWGIE
ncbi:hypothetical protein ACE6H2_001290 [Prunus campanulata]